MTPEQKQIADLQQRLLETWMVMDSIADTIEAIVSEMDQHPTVNRYVEEMKHKIEAFKENVI